MHHFQFTIGSNGELAFYYIQTSSATAHFYQICSIILVEFGLFCRQSLSISTMTSPFHAAAMLPAEITNLIIDNLGFVEEEDNIYDDYSYYDTDATVDGHYSLACYAPVSRIWQHLIEARTFRNIALNPARILSACRVLCQRRKSYIRSVTFNLVVENESLHRSQLYGWHRSYFLKYKPAFTKTILPLLELLASASSFSLYPIEFKMNIPVVRWKLEDEVHDLPHRHPLNLLIDVEALPDLPRVSRFVVDQHENIEGCGFEFSPSAIFDIASKMRCLASVTWRFSQISHQEVAGTSISDT